MLSERAAEAELREPERRVFRPRQLGQRVGLSRSVRLRRIALTGDGCSSVSLADSSPISNAPTCSLLAVSVRQPKGGQLLTRRFCTTLGDHVQAAQPTIRPPRLLHQLK